MVLKAVRITLSTSIFSNGLVDTSPGVFSLARVLLCAFSEANIISVRLLVSYS